MSQPVRKADELPAVGTPVERPVGRPAPKRDKPLSYRQRDVLAKAPADWGKLPGGIGCTNASLDALERRGLVETRYGIAGGFVFDGRQYLGWQWRKTPNARLSGPQRPAQEVEHGTE